MSKKELVATINNACANGDMIYVVFSCGNSGISTHCVPEIVEEHDGKLLVISGHDVYDLDVTNVEYDDIEGFICTSGDCVVTISVD